MHTITTIGLDIAKSVFQVHGIDAEGKVVVTGPSDARVRFGLRLQIDSSFIKTGYSLILRA